MIPNDSLFQSLKNTMLSNAHAVAEVITPVLQHSRFTETGVLTPNEFVLAGDMLVAKCPSWSWAQGDADKVRAHLPPNKQFLITKRVPCRMRANAAVELQSNQTLEVEEEDGWLKTGGGNGAEEYTDLDASANASAAQTTTAEEDYVDLEAYEEEAGLVHGDESTLANNLVLRTRTYDLTIMYDKYYQTPRMFLVGYDEQGRALTPSQVFQDISQDYANKTATIEPHPHLGALPQCVSIHPCKHAAIMKKFVDRLSGGDAAKARVDQALIIFLKFMQGLLPTIDYDFTMEVKF